MSSFSDQLEQVKTLINSSSKQHKSLAYSNLLHLQEQSNDHLSYIQALADASLSVMSLLAVDISDDDEEIAAQALKCLGFMIYHPCIVSSIPVDDANMVLKALAKVIISTKIKPVCNLGVWCLSMQKLDMPVLAGCFQLLLHAVVHALENPVGSLSTTFEAMQAVIKLASQLTEKMRESSHLWAPPIWRRLISVDKRERDMSQRCLLKIKSVILPPPATLSKALAKDMKYKLLPGMMDLLDQGIKVQTIQAWGWFIRFLGSHGIKNRNLLNDMLKIPEQTFCDHSAQVQIASQVAWEGLVDFVFHSQILTGENDDIVENSTTKGQHSGVNCCQLIANGLLKRVKLIMTPIIGTISSKCDASVHSACLNTWSYLLYKLDIYINHQSVVELVVNPIFEAVFRMGPDSKTAWSWNMCLDMLDDLLLSKCRHSGTELSSQESSHLSVKTSILATSIPEDFPWKHHIKWFPWAVGQLDFFIKMIDIIVSHTSATTISTEIGVLAGDAALRIFRSLLRGVQVELKSPSATYADVMSCLNTILGFLKKICENGTSEETEFCHTAFKFLEAAIVELEPSILGSPLYKVALDIRYIENLQLGTDSGSLKFLHTSSNGLMDMVLPIVYMLILYISVLIQVAFDAERMESILQGLQRHFKFMLCSYDPQENICIAVGLLYNQVGNRYLYLWIAIANGLKDYIDAAIPPLKMESGNQGLLAICHLLSYPFVVCSSPQQNLILDKVTCSLDDPHMSRGRKFELENVLRVWKSLYGALCGSNFKVSASNTFVEDLCSSLNRCIDENGALFNCINELDLSHVDHQPDLLSLFGEVVTCIFGHIIFETSADGKRTNHHNEPNSFNGLSNCLGLAGRLLKFSRAKLGTYIPADILLTSRVFASLACFVSCLHLKQTSLSCIQIITDPLLQWLSLGEIPEAINDQLQRLWAEILDCLKRSQPPIVFDSTFLKLQAPLLQKTLNHPRPTIADPTIDFWNATYSKQIKLDYPGSLLEILHKLSRENRISLHKKAPSFPVNCNFVSKLTAQGYSVAMTHNRNSKRVELVKGTKNAFKQKEDLSSNSKRKRLELTEHQQEVRRAQQGREMDCNGHGPGIRTYTSIDFSQGNEDSQESQEVRNPESTLELLRRLA